MSDHILIQFDLSKIDVQKLFQVEKLLSEMGITFDTGAGFGYRDWEWDWSLEGPVKVTHKQAMPTSHLAFEEDKLEKLKKG